MKNNSEKKRDLFAEVAVEVPIEGVFTYAVPTELATEVELGRRVLVPFGKRTLTGYVVGSTSEPEVDDIKPLVDVLDPYPLFDAKKLGFFRWLASYYFAPLGEVLSMIRPAGAAVQSRRRVTLTEEGRAALEKARGVEREVLQAAEKGVMLHTLARRLKRVPVYSTAGRLIKKGLLAEERLLHGGAGEKMEKHVRPLMGCAPEEVFSRSPVQKKVFDYLRREGGASLKKLTAEFGGAGDIVKRLEEKGLIEVTEKRVMRNPLSDFTPRSLPHEPNPDQRVAIDAVTSALGKNVYSPFLLYGVTGSGKTLVYLKVLEEALSRGKKAILLAPEISLTPWPAAYLMEKFPGRVALAHSGLSEGERYDEWRRIVEGNADIVVGARSALFSPLNDLGLIIVDEEHETSYKQEEGVKYNARDAALMLGKTLGIAVVLGSATPSIETFYNSQKGKLTPLYIKSRVMERTLPGVELVDMRGRKDLTISEELKTMLEETFSDGHQGLLFLNRRGFSSFLICRDCGHAFNCLNCSVTLTVHKSSRSLKCHYCDFSLKIPEECTGCRGSNLTTPGMGTEKVEEEVREMFPHIRVARMDRDTTRRKGSVKKIIDAVEEKKVDLLIGTQMVSKGHDFPGVTLVGVISGDTSLNIPDFRSSERTFQLITQAAGRAGRGEAPGRVIVQTLNPGHYCFTNASRHDYESFYDEELGFREELLYPPFTRLCCLRVEAPGDKEAARAAGMLHDMAVGLRRKLGKAGMSIALLGPTPALLSKLKGRYRWNTLVKGSDVKTLHPFVKALKKGFESRALKRVSISVDMDPITVV